MVATAVSTPHTRATPAAGNDHAEELTNLRKGRAETLEHAKQLAVDLYSRGLLAKEHRLQIDIQLLAESSRRSNELEVVVAVQKGEVMVRRQVASPECGTIPSQA